jgi:tyrosyl-tRNA synthetase
MFTSQQLIQRRNFKDRWDKGKEIGLHELDYPLLQGYDSVAVKSDIEIGGTDQLFNLLAGRKIQEKFGLAPQDVMTYKMLIGLDGRKMSTSWGNVVNITDEPNEMFGKIMSMHDEQILEYFELCTTIDPEEIKKIENPRDQKAKLAFEIVKMYHGSDKAEKAEKEFENIFKSKKLPIDIPTIKANTSEIMLIDFLAENNLVSSKSEARRLIEQGGVSIRIKDKELRIKNINEKIKIIDDIVLKIGKRKFVKIVKS